MGKQKRNQPGIRRHIDDDLSEDEVTTLHGIFIATPARTLLDIAEEVSTRDLEQALAKALGRGMTSIDELRILLARHPRHLGAPRLHALLDGDTPPALTRSRAEERLLDLLRRADLPPPDLNVMVNGCELDFYWRDRALAVEVDGFAHHASRQRFVDDRRRAACLAAAGIHTIRVTRRQLEAEPFAVLARLGQALAMAGPNVRAHSPAHGSPGG